MNHFIQQGMVLNRPNLPPWLVGYRVNAFTCTWEYINYSESVLRRTRITADSRVSSDFISSSPRVCCLWYQLWSCLALTPHIIELHSRSVIVQISEEVIYRFADLLFAQIKLQKFLGRIVPFDEVALELPFYCLIPFGLFILEFKWLELVLRFVPHGIHQCAYLHFLQLSPKAWHRLNKWIHKWSQLEQFSIAWLTSSSLLSVVCQVEELQEGAKNHHERAVWRTVECRTASLCSSNPSKKVDHYTHCDDEYYQPQQFTHCKWSLHKVMWPCSEVCGQILCCIKDWMKTVLCKFCLKRTTTLMWMNITALLYN